MEDPEVPTEHLHEDMEHHAAHYKCHGPWTSVALSLGPPGRAWPPSARSRGPPRQRGDGRSQQIRSSDKWAYYQAKGIKSSVLSSKIEILEAEGKPVSAKDLQKVADYKKDQDDISAEATEMEHSAEGHLKVHVVFARAVTLFQIAIAIGAIAALTNRRPFWFLSLIFGAVGIFFLVSWAGSPTEGLADAGEVDVAALDVGRDQLDLHAVAHPSGWRVR